MRYVRLVSAACENHPASQAEGRAWSLEEAIRYALEEAAQPP